MGLLCQLLMEEFWRESCKETSWRMWEGILGNVEKAACQSPGILWQFVSDVCDMWVLLSSCAKSIALVCMEQCQCSQVVPRSWFVTAANQSRGECGQQKQGFLSIVTR